MNQIVEISADSFERVIERGDNKCNNVLPFLSVVNVVCADILFLFAKVF